jgi:hypothetical protein
MTRDPKRRARLRAWIESIEPTHALTLVVNRPMSVRNLKSAFGHFCIDLDRMNLGHLAAEKRMPVDRFQALMFIEHPDLRAEIARIDAAAIASAAVLMWDCGGGDFADIG